jgi:hypothetical protein
LRTSLNIKKKRAKKSKHLHLSQKKEFHSNAVFYSPSTIREGFELEDQKERKKEAEQLQKNTRKSCRRPIIHIKSRLQPRNESSVNVTVRPRRRRRMQGWQNILPQRSANNRNAML